MKLQVLILLVLQTFPNLTDQKCINHKVDPRHFYHDNEALDLKILTTERLTHQIVSTILKVFAEDVLGYNNVSLVKIQDPRLSFEPEVQFSNISSCELKDCSDLDMKLDQRHPIPNAMVNLETWLPANFQVDDWQVKDLGPLGTGGRFGWYMPESFAEDSTDILDHWRAFTDPELTTLFAPSESDLNFILPRLKDGNERFFCEDEVLCEGRGMFIPPQCGHQRHGRGGQNSNTARNCALMITDFPVNSMFYSTLYVKRQIEELGLLVKIAFVGDHFEEVVEYLSNESKDVAQGTKSFLLFHYSPSLITNSYNLTTIKFDPCHQPWTAPIYHANRSVLTNCLYEYNRFAKVIWPKLSDGARPFYEALKHIELSPETYREVLSLYAEMKSNTIGYNNTPELLNDVACKWLTSEDPWRLQPNWKRWIEQRTTKKKLKIAGIFPLTGSKYKAPELLPVMNMALSDIRKDGTILNNYELSSVIVDGQCKSDKVMNGVIEIITNQAYKKSFVGILGPACSDTVEPVLGISKHVRSVIITYSAEGSFSDREGKETNFRYFFRTIAENKQYKYAYLQVLKKIGWSHVASLTQDGHRYSEYISSLQDTLQKNSILFISNRKFQRETTEMSMYLKDLKSRGARVIIGEFFEHAARSVMCEAYKLGMTQVNGFVWFLPGWYQNNWYDLDVLRSEKPNAKFPDCTTSQMVEALQGHLSLLHAYYGNENDIMQTGKTVSQWRDQLKKMLSNTNMFNHTPPNKYSGYVYDAVWLYALALDKLDKEYPAYIQDIHSQRSNDKFVEIIRKTDFNGTSGRINFDHGHGNSRLSNIKIIQWYENTSHVIGEYQPNYTNDSSKGNGKLIEWNRLNLKWYTPDGLQPTDKSKECSILSDFAEAMNLECEKAITVAFVGGFGSLFIMLLLIFIIVKRRYDKRMRLTEERMRALGLLTPSCVLTLDEWEIPRDRVVINRKLGEGAFGTVYGGEAFFDEKGWVAVAVKTLKTGSTVEEKLDFLSEADMMKRFDHKNIVKLLGVCTRNEPIYTVMEFMLYGDLKTYLLARRHLVNERNREELDEVSNRRLTSMALDIARGLTYLAELKYVHRDMACRNCLVNSTRVVKLADFGMTRPMFENDYYRFSRKGMLPVRWMAPESLADGLFTPMSDIWSYGVLLYEMITFGSFPFQGLSNNQVMEHVKAGQTLTIPSGIKSQLETLLKSCWHMTATKRPTASEIAELLSNNPRLISPCIDVPLASVQVERTDSLELIPSVRNPKGMVSQTNRPQLGLRRSRGPLDGTSLPPIVNENSKGSSISAPYSPMSGVPCGNGFLLNGGSPSSFKMVDLTREPLLPSSQLCRSTTPPPVGSYVPPGYILVDHGSKNRSSSTVTSPERDKEVI